jgi:hypothetical protein
MVVRGPGSIRALHKRIAASIPASPIVVAHQPPGVRDPIDVHDLHATLLHYLGIDHTPPPPSSSKVGKVVKDVLA